MTTLFKLIIPLLDADLSEDLFTPEAGFLGAFNADINRPFLDNHIFLMYVADLSLPGNYYRNERIMKMKNLYNRRTIRIKSILVTIYTFCITNSAIKHILKGYLFLTNDEIQTIIHFWKYDENIYMSIITHTVLGGISNAVVPEQDYQPLRTTRPVPPIYRLVEPVYFFIVTISPIVKETFIFQ